jgi:hypothetical protein
MTTTIGRDLFRSLLRRHAAGVVVITVSVEHSPAGRGHCRAGVKVAEQPHV